MSLWVFVHQSTASNSEWLLEDGFRWVLENGNGFWILE